jgi:hypothetical protein
MTFDQRPHAHPIEIGLAAVVADVGADSDMVDAGDVDGPRHHLAPASHAVASGLRRDVAIGGAADDAALLAQRLDHIVALVALVGKERGGVGMGHGHMRQIDENAGLPGHVDAARCSCRATLV